MGHDSRNEERRSNHLGLIIGPRNPRNHRPKFQTEFGVPEEEANGPFLWPLQRYRQPCGNHVACFQHPGIDRAHLLGAPCQSQSLLPRLLEPLLVGQVIGRLKANLVHYLQFFLTQLSHRCDLLAPAVGDLLTISSYGW